MAQHARRPLLPAPAETTAELPTATEAALPESVLGLPGVGLRILHEELRIAALDTHGRVRETRLLARGIDDGLYVGRATVLRIALDMAAHSFVLAQRSRWSDPTAGGGCRSRPTWPSGSSDMPSRASYSTSDTRTRGSSARSPRGQESTLT
ncbi:MULTISPECIES: hypothetical protein [Sorangium]|uniref:hypothetical protein n=1 Tax=Sorangium TaxID=39643 RepID=UPI003D9C62A0